jgi:hypothetical protein
VKENESVCVCVIARLVFFLWMTIWLERKLEGFHRCLVSTCEDSNDFVIRMSKNAKKNVCRGYKQGS